MLRALIPARYRLPAESNAMLWIFRGAAKRFWIAYGTPDAAKDTASEHHRIRQSAAGLITRPTQARQHPPAKSQSNWPPSTRAGLFRHTREAFGHPSTLGSVWQAEPPTVPLPSRPPRYSITSFLGQLERL
jgi:hypothetical protein